ncbi:vesicle transport protein USE1-like [Dreissena polymorpha]|uniref:Vesicle transport protein USE1 n=1 Tax=Dreissena polymorpha TaxID=45954 RepID=A0A9D4KCQ2_DREPO|nr:vesicle transport protein USE1-like [Dreissena polymorpha]KAH3837427.1 hypothetical protein DPMN_110816 [Dreissena polymorpha]
MSTKLEINFTRLLNRCETIASQRDTWDWRLEKYVEALQDQLGEMKRLSRQPSQPSQDIMLEYTRRVDFLKGLLAAEQKENISEKAYATERLAPVSNVHKGSGIAPKEVHLSAMTRLQKDMRTELLGEDKPGDGLRQRKHTDESDIDAVLKHHRKVHEKLTEELLHHTLNLKEFAYSASSIVKKDIKTLEDTNKVADRNQGDLQRESQRLESKTRGCSWWIWIMLALVTLTFLWMIILMRMFPARS